MTSQEGWIGYFGGGGGNKKALVRSDTACVANRVAVNEYKS